MTTPKKGEIHYSYKRAMKRRVTYVLIGVAAGYFYAVFPTAAVAQVVGGSPPSWAGVIVRAFGTASAVTLLSFLLFASDSAFRGTSKTAGWIRERFAYHAAIRQLGCTPPEASELWFKYFDTWSHQGSPHRHLLLATYDATYAARMVFYLKRALWAFIVLTLGTVCAQWLAFGTYRGSEGHRLLAVHLGALVVYILALIFVEATNRRGDTLTPPTGCWSRVAEVFARSAVAFSHDVLSHASSLKEAFARVEQIRTDLKGHDSEA